MTIRIPTKADIETQNAFRDIEQRLRAIEGRKESPKISTTEVATLKADIEKMKADPDKYEELRETTFVAPVNFSGDAGFTGNVYPGFLTTQPSGIGSSAQKTMNMHGSLAISPGGLSADSLFARKADIQGGDVFAPGGVRSQTAYIKRVANQAIGNTSYTDVDYDTETANPDSLWASGDSTKINIIQDGLWLIVSNVVWATNATGYRTAELYLNNTTTIARDASPGGAVGCSVSFLGELSDGDFIETRVYQSSGGDLNLTGNIGAYFVCRTS